MALPWTATRRDTLRAFCDTIFAEVRTDSDPHGFWARKASDFGVDAAAADALDSADHAAVHADLLDLLDGLAGLSGTLGERETAVRAAAARSAEAAAATAALIRLVLILAYGLIGDDGRNPNWPALSYPGPVPRPRAVDKPIKPLVIDRDDLVLDADVCVIGSGAGGGVIAGELARRGVAVIVVEAGDYFNEADFQHRELWAFRNLYWRGGYVATADGNALISAGGTLGGGTQVNWENCVRTPPWVRREWAADHGLDELDGAGFDRALDAVAQRLLVNDRCNELNGPHQRLEAGARALGFRIQPAQRNIDPDRHDPALAGFHGYGDPTGSRQSTVNTYLATAQAHGARIVVRARAERIVVEAGCAAGVEVIATGRDGVARRLVVRTRRVVAACGALETPALLLRSAIGGPAVGRYLRIHPSLMFSGVYGEDLRGWWGPPQALLVDEFAQLAGDHGFLLENTHHALTSAAAFLAWSSAAGHKAAMSVTPRCASLIALVREHGHGRVTIDANGACVPSYAITDPRDIAIMHRAIRELSRLHQAAGARYISVNLSNGLMRWKAGEPLDAFIQRLQSTRLGAGGQLMYSSHQMGTARMGRDPRDSVAQPTGELHDIRGVWIGDTSAFPTAIGVNPMITCMALAVRTADYIAATIG